MRLKLFRLLFITILITLVFSNSAQSNSWMTCKFIFENPGFRMSDPQTYSFSDLMTKRIRFELDLRDDPGFRKIREPQILAVEKTINTILHKSGSFKETRTMIYYLLTKAGATRLKELLYDELFNVPETPDYSIDNIILRTLWSEAFLQGYSIEFQTGRNYPLIELMAISSHLEKNLSVLDLENYRKIYSIRQNGTRFFFLVQDPMVLPRFTLSARYISKEELLGQGNKTLNDWISNLE